MTTGQSPFANCCPDIEVTVVGGGSTAGVSSLSAGTPNVTLLPASGTGDVQISVQGDGTGIIQQLTSTNSSVTFNPSNGSAAIVDLSVASALPLGDEVNDILQWNGTEWNGTERRNDGGSEVSYIQYCV